MTGATGAALLVFAGWACASEAELINDGPWTSSDLSITWEFQPGRLEIIEAHEGFDIVYRAEYSVSEEDNTITYKVLDVERRTSSGMTEEAPNYRALVGETFSVTYSLDTAVGTLNLNGEIFRN